jgi:hypothetical protein
MAAGAPWWSSGKDSALSLPGPGFGELRSLQVTENYPPQQKKESERWMRVHACVLSHFSRVQLFCPHGLQPSRLLCPWDSPSRILEWVAMPSSSGYSQPRDESHISYVTYLLCISSWVLYR